MPNGKLVEGVQQVGPGGKMVIHEGVEALVVAGFEQVNHFVDDDVFETGWWFLGKFGVEADGVGGWGAATPFGFHVAHTEASDGDAQTRLPCGYEGRDGLFEQITIPGGQDGFAAGGVYAWAEGEP